MAKGTVTVTTTKPPYMTRGTILSLGSDPGTNFYVIGEKSATELYVASTWRDSLWVPWFQVTRWFAARRFAVRLWFSERWEKLNPEETLKDDRVFVAEDSGPELKKDPRDPSRWN